MKEKIHDLLWAIGERYEDNADLHMNPMTVKQAAAHIAELFHERVAALREQYRVQAELAKQYREMSLEYESQLAAKDAALLIEHNLAEERGQKRDAALAQLAEMAEALVAASTSRNWARGTSEWNAIQRHIQQALSAAKVQTDRPLEQQGMIVPDKCEASSCCANDQGRCTVNELMIDEIGMCTSRYPKRVLLRREGKITHQTAGHEGKATWIPFTTPPPIGEVIINEFIGKDGQQVTVLVLEYEPRKAAEEGSDESKAQ